MGIREQRGGAVDPRARTAMSWADGERDTPSTVDEVFDLDAPAPRPRAHPPSRRTSSARDRRFAGWRPLSLIGAAILAAIIVVVLNDQPTRSLPPAVAVATPTATPTPTPTADTASAPASLGPYWPAQIGLPVITVPADLVRTAPFDPGPSASPTGASSGPLVFGPGAARGINMVDIGRGTSTPLNAPIRSGEMVSSGTMNGNWLALGVTDVDKACGPSVPWRLLVVELGPNGPSATGPLRFSEVAHGTDVGHPIPEQSDCLVSANLQIGLANGRLAWTEERAGRAGSVVKIRTLGSNGGTRTFTSAKAVVELALSADAVAWVDSSDPLAWQLLWSTLPVGPRPADWQVMRAALADRSALPVDIGEDGASGSLAPPQITLDGSAVLATLVGKDGSTGSVVRADAAGLVVIDDGAGDRSCTAWGVVEGATLLTCGWPGIVDSSSGQQQPLSLLTVWTPTRGLRAVGVGDAPAMGWSVVATAGWAIVARNDGWTAIPVSALTSP